MNSFLRNWATPLSFITFLAVAITGLMLFFGVRGGPLGDVHEWVGVAFILSLGLHLGRNWRGVLAMLSLPRSKAIVGGLGAVLAVLILAVTPFGSNIHGHGPHGPWQVANRVAQAPIAKMAPAFGLTSAQAMARLKQGGIDVNDPQKSLAEIAEEQDAELPRLMNLVLNTPDEDG